MPVLHVVGVSVVACVLAMAGGYLWGNKNGADSIRSEWQRERLEAHITLEKERQRVADIERQMEQSVRKQADAHSADVRRREAAAISARRELDRLRDSLASAVDRGPIAAPANDRPSTDGASAAVAELLRKCAAELVAMGDAAGRLAGQVSGLQQYVKTIEAH